MKKIALATLALTLASCSSAPLQKANLEYKVFPKVANFKYEFNVAIPQVVDARNEDFVLGQDDYFAKPIAKSLSNILFEEIRSTNAFNTVALLDQPIDFNPTSTQIQEIRRSVGKDAIFLAQVNKFNANIRKLSDTDTSSFVNLKVFTNITYKLILVDSESVIFLTTKDTSTDKTVPLNEELYKTINELAINNIKENIVAAKKDFILTTKGTLSGEDAKAKQQVRQLKVEKEFNLQEHQLKQEQQEAADKAAAEAVTAKQVDEQAPQEQPTKQPTEQTTTQAAELKQIKEPTELIASEDIEVPAETVTEETAKEISTEITKKAEAETITETVKPEATVETIVEQQPVTTKTAEATVADFTETTR